uniref:Uncharacterized protein n=1 Tax=Lepeophtheirus salmonis TaxID=72036 RepID=A0A0K2UMG6_LEPSM
MNQVFFFSDEASNFKAPSLDPSYNNLLGSLRRWRN